MPNFAKRCKKQLRKIFCSSCICSKDVKDQPEPPLNEPEAVTSPKLEILLLKTLKNQIEERDYRDQLRHTLSQITQILDQFGKTCDLQQKRSQRFPNDGFSQFTITVSKDSLIHCKSDTKRKSLVVVNEQRNGHEAVGRNNSVVLQKCTCNDVINLPEALLPRGAFSSIFSGLLRDKAVQYDSTHNLQAFQTNSKLIQTQLLNFSNFNAIKFKIKLVKHIRSLKNDVITLRQLLFSLEHYPAGCKLNSRNLAILSPKATFLGEQEVEYKFFKAKETAANFMKFYTLRKKLDKKNK